MYLPSSLNIESHGTKEGVFLYVVSSKGNDLDNGKPEKGRSPILVGVSCVNVWVKSYIALSSD